MILALDTAAGECQMTIIVDNVVVHKTWLAERRLARDLLSQLEIFLHDNQTSFDQLTGLIVFRGPGSYTGLRIGVNVMNSLAYGLTLPIVGETGSHWLESGRTRLARGDHDHIVIPEYGGLPNITVPKK
jgi:tRNA threonylcarbamoyladenosine biosynthesis protein TsaB